MNYNDILENLSTENIKKLYEDIIISEPIEKITDYCFWGKTATGADCHGYTTGSWFYSNGGRIGANCWGCTVYSVTNGYCADYNLPGPSGCH